MTRDWAELTLEDPDTLLQEDRAWQAAPCVGTARRRQSCIHRTLLLIRHSWTSRPAGNPSSNHRSLCRFRADAETAASGNEQCHGLPLLPVCTALGAWNTALQDWLDNMARHKQRRLGRAAEHGGVSGPDGPACCANATTRPWTTH